MTKTTTLASLVRHAKRDTMITRHRSAVNDTLMQHPAVKATFMLLPPAVRADAWLSPPGSHDTIVGIGVSMRNLSGFKDKALLKVLERFAGDAWTATTHDWTSVLNRDFRFKRSLSLTPEEQSAIARHPSARWLVANGYDYAVPRGLTVSVTVSAYVKSDSETCRVVVKGVTERVIREEVKEFVCD